MLAFLEQIIKGPHELELFRYYYVYKYLLNPLKKNRINC